MIATCPLVAVARPLVASLAPASRSPTRAPVRNRQTGGNLQLMFKHGHASCDGRYRAGCDANDDQTLIPRSRLSF